MKTLLTIGALSIASLTGSNAEAKTLHYTIVTSNGFQQAAPIKNAPDHYSCSYIATVLLGQFNKDVPESNWYKPEMVLGNTLGTFQQWEFSHKKFSSVVVTCQEK